MLRQFPIATVTLMLLAVAGCGIKGPLVLPPPAPAAAIAPAPATTPATTAPPATDPASPRPAAAERKP